jgi:hypothetical protein
MTPAVRFPSEREDSELRGADSRGRRRTKARSLNLREWRCPVCGESKPAEEFALDASKPSGYGTYCLRCDRERSKRYYAANREKVLAKAAEKRGPQPERYCSEDGVPLEGRQRVVCSPRCRDARFKRLHPEAYAAKEARKIERRRRRRSESSGCLRVRIRGV